MSPTTRSGAGPVVRPRPPRLSQQERLELLLWQTGRSIVPIRNTVHQQGRGINTKPGPLARFVTSHDVRGLDTYLVIHAMASAPPWNCCLPSEAWIGALGLADTASMESAKTTLAKIMRRLEDRKLIKRERSKRLSNVILLKEDGSGEAFERPRKDKLEDRWLQLPHSYWLEGHYRTLHLPAKAMLLIALSRPDGFVLPYDRAYKWYGISSDSAEDGLRQLRDVGILSVERDWILAPRSEMGWTEQFKYTLQGSFSQTERKKASRTRRRAREAPGGGLEDDEFAPVVPMPMLDDAPTERSEDSA